MKLCQVFANQAIYNSQAYIKLCHMISSNLRERLNTYKLVNTKNLTTQGGFKSDLEKDFYLTQNLFSRRLANSLNSINILPSV